MDSSKKWFIINRRDGIKFIGTPDFYSDGETLYGWIDVHNYHWVVWEDDMIIPIEVGKEKNVREYFKD